MCGPIDQSINLINLQSEQIICVLFCLVLSLNQLFVCVSINQLIIQRVSLLLAKQLLQCMQSNQPINQSTSVNQFTVNQAAQWTLISVSTIWGR